MGVFEYDGAPVEAWITGQHWHVRFDGREAQARTVGEALEELMGDSKRHGERRRRDGLILQILMWSRSDDSRGRHTRTTTARVE
jgi:hypothetical protein